VADPLWTLAASTRSPRCQPELSYVVSSVHRYHIPKEWTASVSEHSRGGRSVPRCMMNVAAITEHTTNSTENQARETPIIYRRLAFAMRRAKAKATCGSEIQTPAFLTSSEKCTGPLMTRYVTLRRVPSPFTAGSAGGYVVRTSRTRPPSGATGRTWIEPTPLAVVRDDHRCLFSGLLPRSDHHDRLGL
jgi:hypothetical protein